MDASYREPDSDAVPISYAVLSLPSKAEMRKKGYDPSCIVMNGLEGHPLAVWRTYSLPRGTTYKDAVTAVQDANNAKAWGPLKARLYFSDGTQEMYARRDPNQPATFSNCETYDPNEVFHKETLQRTTTNHASLQPRLKPLVDTKGHPITSKKDRPRSFAPEVLYKNCPPPLHAQPGYDFTPMSYHSFMLKPHDPLPGVRNVQSNFMHSSTDYRPRSYLRNGPMDSRHCHSGEVYQVGDYTMDLARLTDVVDNRNYVTMKQSTKLGTVVPHSTIVGRRYVKEPRFPSIGRQTMGGTTTAAAAAAEQGASALSQNTANASQRENEASAVAAAEA